MNKILSGAPEFVAPAVFSGQLQQMRSLNGVVRPQLMGAAWD